MYISPIVNCDSSAIESLQKKKKSWTSNISSYLWPSEQRHRLTKRNRQLFSSRYVRIAFINFRFSSCSLRTFHIVYEAPGLYTTAPFHKQKETRRFDANKLNFPPFIVCENNKWTSFGGAEERTVSSSKLYRTTNSFRNMYPDWRRRWCVLERKTFIPERRIASAIRSFLHGRCQRTMHCSVEKKRMRDTLKNKGRTWWRIYWWTLYRQGKTRVWLHSSERDTVQTALHSKKNINERRCY